VPEVPKEFQLNYYVGDIVISDSFAEHAARVFWHTLGQVGLVSGGQPEMFGRLLPKLVMAVDAPALPAEFREIAVPLLELAQKWHRYRRDLVHDLLVTGWGEGNDVRSAIGKHPVRPMSDLIECSEQLRKIGWRLRGLSVIAPYWLNGVHDEWEEADNLRSWTRVAMGHIAERKDVIVGTTGPAPEPPGGWDAIIASVHLKRDASFALQASVQNFFIDDYDPSADDGGNEDRKRK